MTRAQQIAEYNKKYPSYNITKIKKFYGQPHDLKAVWGETSLYELYKKPSQAKVQAWQQIHHDYNPKEILSVQGNSMTYSVFLIAGNGDVLHITRDNNYLIELA